MEPSDDVPTSLRSETPPITPQTVENMAQELQMLRRAVSTGSMSMNVNAERKANSNWLLFKDDRLLSEFDPSQSGLSVDDWLRKINDCACLYHWDEVTTVYLALGKLKGLARVWYDGLSSNQFTWKEWQDKLRKTFPAKENFSKLFHEAATYKIEPGQNLSEYCFNKLTKLNKLKLNLSDEQIVDCVIAGVSNKQILLSLRAANCKTFVELTQYVLNFQTANEEPHNNLSGSTSKTEYQKRGKRNYLDVAQNSTESKRFRDSSFKCFTCGEVGHKRLNCPLRNRQDFISRKIICSYCNKLGHKEDACRKKIQKISKVNQNQKTVNFIGTNKPVSIYHKQAKINNFVVSCFVDLGSESTLLRKSVADKIKLKQQSLEHVVELYGFNSDSSVLPKLKCIVNITIDSVTIETQVYIVNDSDIRYDLLVGHTFTEHPSVLIIKTYKCLQITRLPTDETFNLGNRYVINSIETVNKQTTIEQNLQCGDITSTQRTKLCKLLNEFKGRFSFNLADLGKTNTAIMNIQCVTEKPIVYAPYRLSLSERNIVKNMISELLKNNIIRESRSPYASPILLVGKKDGGQRLCVDFRALNQITKKDRYPLPLIEDHLDRLGGYNFFITLDLASGFYQVPMSDDSIEKTAFVTPDGHYEFLRMPFGLANAPSVFQRLMNSVLGNLRYEIALVYIDDVIIPARTVKDGLKKLRLVLQKLQEHNLTLKLSKCSFFQSKLEYLGREISSSGVQPGIKKIIAIKDMPRPRNVKQVRQFLGLAGYFRKFVNNFAIITQPLTKLLKKDCPWEWSDKQENAMNFIKTSLVTRPILAIFNPNLKTEVHTDASKIGLAGILIQINNENNKQVVAYYSRQNTALEQKYHSYELETLAALESLRHFRVYLVGIKFKLVTDCSAIRSTAVKRDIIPRIGRWWMELQDYDFDVEYRPGAKMTHVDCLSRNPPVSEVGYVNSIINITEADWLQAVQLQDDEISKIREILISNNRDPSTKLYFENYVLKEGKVHRKLDGGAIKWLVPRANRWQICKLCHDDIGHFGFEKTLAKIKENYWFSGMHRFVKKYVNACLNCLYYKTPSGRKPGQLHPIDKVSVPYHTVHIDHLGPFIKSRKKNTQLLVIIDGFSKFSIIEPVRSTKAKYVIRALEDIINIFGVPVRVISDRGSAFTSHSFKTFCTEYGIKHVLNAVATPRANGQCERFNRTILSSLAAMNGGCEDDKWDVHVKAVQRGLNGTVHRVLGTTPAEVLFGCKPRSAAESILLNELQDELDRVDLCDLRQKVQTRVVADQTLQKKRFDAKRSKPVDYQVGDLITVAKTDLPATGESKKLLPKFKGPYRITAKLPNDRYAALKVSERYRKCPIVVCVDKMKPWVTLGEVVSI